MIFDVNKNTLAETCPECGAPMFVNYLMRKSGSLFLWFECVRDGCSGALVREFILSQKRFGPPANVGPTWSAEPEEISSLPL